MDKYQGKDINGRRIKLIDDTQGGHSRSRSRSPRSRSRSPASRSRSPRSRSPVGNGGGRGRSRSRSYSGSRSPVPMGTRHMVGQSKNSVIQFTILIIELQNGKPICGFSSLTAAAKTLCDPDALFTIDEAMRIAKEMGKTKEGEIFSADWMAEISNHLFPTTHAYASAFPTPSALLTVLGSKKKQLILVPYDCDKNFEPCEKDGKNAHWAVLTGFLVAKPECENNKISWFDPKHRMVEVEDERLFIIAFHGKSK
uniref:Actin maturation protease n=1 Tax=Ditylenchus dipsaci TaxID=166011 RepID=A0A915ENL2_9BILA